MVKVFKPIGKKEDLLKYFKLEKDEENGDIEYLTKEVKLDLESPLVAITLDNFEQYYNEFDSEHRNMLESEGLRFEYVLNPDQTSSYRIIADDKAKEYVANCVLNIAVYDVGTMEEMVLVTQDGVCYGHVSYLNSLDEEGKAFVNMLIKNKLIKVKNIKAPEPVDFDDVDY